MSFRKASLMTGWLAVRPASRDGHRRLDVAAREALLDRLPRRLFEALQPCGSFSRVSMVLPLTDLSSQAPWCPRLSRCAREACHALQCHPRPP